MASKTKPKEVGRRIHERRVELGLTQRQIGEQGASYAYISRIEGGSRNPSYEVLVQLAAKLDTTALELLTGKPDAACPFCGH